MKIKTRGLDVLKIFILTEFWKSHFVRGTAPDPNVAKNWTRHPGIRSQPALSKQRQTVYSSEVIETDNRQIDNQTTRQVNAQLFT